MHERNATSAKLEENEEEFFVRGSLAIFPPPRALRMLSRRALHRSYSTVRSAWGRSTDADGDEDVAAELLFSKICTRRPDNGSFIDAMPVALHTHDR
jgi:hypothetical protein